MHPLFSSGLAALSVAVLVVIAWHFRRRQRGWPSRRQDYAWVLLHAGIAYMITCFLVQHFIFEVPYDKLLAKGYGEQQVNIAFAGAVWESLRSLLLMWTGKEVL
jgi:drug/metabolite transporter (DMT)-like permease